MTSIEQVAEPATLGAVGAVLVVVHNVADHVIGQSDRQAAGKAAPSATEVADGVIPQKGWARAWPTPLLSGISKDER
ncbi:hypothetical protein [Streptomyces palmae]|uniref:Uncharacterized protein n=1 Tax=Streptomyces palmae TaxID=1701085 RepID=A0A4Z0FZ40_9ACTN|nr:hypothetical protein [Streptomyces palmae]TGA86880.1 hypothetical protein E4099_30235 [Streptomyces palmae]